MAITDTEMPDLFSRVFLTVLRQSNVLVSQCDRQWEAEVRRAEHVSIPLSENTPTLSDYTHGSAWGTAADQTNVSYTEIELDVARQIISIVPKKTQRNMSYSVVTQLAEDIGEVVAKETDKKVFDTVKAATLATGHHAGQFGIAANYLDTSGNAAGTAPDITTLVWAPLRAIRRTCNQKNLTGKAARQQSRMYIDFDPIFGDALTEFLRKDGGSDMLAYEQVTGRGLQNGYRGTIWGNFDLYETNSASLKAYSSKDHYFLYCGRADSIAYAEALPQLDYWPPEGSPFGPVHRFNGLFEYGCVVTKGDRLVSAAVRAET